MHPSATLERLRQLPDHLTKHVIGQPEACKLVAQAFIRGELDLTKSERPKGSFLLLGPTGVGKTELILTIAKYIYGNESEDRFIRYDMAEYQKDDAIDLFLGKGPGDPGRLGRDLAQLRKAGGSGIILFDEIEKAHPNLTTIFLSILDAARIRLGSGEVVDFAPYYLAYTSNLGSRDIAEMRHSGFATIERTVFDAAKRYFRPEVFARFDNRVVFHPLDDEAQKKIAGLMLEKERKHILSKTNISITWGAGIMKYLIKYGFDIRLGARPLRRAIELGVGNAISARLLDTTKTTPQHLVIDYDPDKEVLVALDSIPHELPILAVV